MAGRPRKWDAERTVRLQFKVTTAEANTLAIVVDYLDTLPHDAAVDKQALLRTMYNEWMQNHASVVQASIAWHKGGRK